MVLCLIRTVSIRARAASFAALRSIASLRWLALTLVAALLVTQMSSVLHELLVSHRVCAEHGHRIHANGTAEPGLDRQVSDRGPAAESSRAADSDHHDHCTAPARPEPTGVSLLRAAVATLAPIADEDRVAPERVTFDAGPSLLLIAPKQSPPV
jgi:hypothetical protein